MLTGIIDGMVMQRDDKNLSDITVYCREGIKTAEYSSGEASGKISVEHKEKSKYRLRGIPAGGPYTLTVNGERFYDIYVGDLWILAGQSNMQGVGRLRPDDYNPDRDEKVRAYYMDGRWRAAKHPLHAAWIENGRVFTEDISYEIPKDKYQGVGPGLQFARVLKNETRVPQGLICTAYGGSSLELWRPFDGMLYNALYNRFIKNGANAAGMLWFQGCADAFDGAADGFESNTVAFFDAVRKSMGVFPIIQFQIGRVVHPALPGLCENWMKIRDFQRTLYKKTDWLYTVSSIGCELDDLIHISADSADNLGKNAANIMLRLKNRRIQPPDLQSVTLCKDEKSGKAVIKIKFQNISGDLKSEGRPSGFTLSDEPYKIVNDTIFDIKLKGDTAFLYLWQTENEALGRYLCYGFGLNPYCNITDGSGSSLPCFGPIEIKE